jgi:polyferredoxin
MVWLVRARRVSQGGFLLLFLLLLVQTAFRGSFSAGAQAPVRLPWPVEIFLSANPFVMLITSLASHKVYAGLIWALPVLALTLLVGRAFCGWICPFGTVHQILSWLWPGPSLRGPSRIQANRPSPLQRVKYWVLLAALGSALLGSAFFGMADPISMMVRGVGLGVLPAIEYLLSGGLIALSESNQAFLQRFADGLSTLCRENIFGPTQPHYHHAWLILGTFGLVLLLNRWVPRFWCRVLCPLGALLGVFSRFALFGLTKDHAKCTDCNLCVVHCQGADAPEGGVPHQGAECHLCFNCETACPEDVLRFEWFPNRGQIQSAPDVGRRQATSALALGAALVPAARVSDHPSGAYSEKVIRPPGSLAEEEFLDRCIRCAECMKVCPNHALHPALFEAGPEGLWTPILIPRIGYCEHSCVLCGQVCPTGAIAKIEEKDKLGMGVPPIRLGTAAFDLGRCLPWSQSTPCTVCEEFCPTSPKAIWVEEVQVPKRTAVASAADAGPSELVTVKRPHLDPALCIGCGACEKVCPVVDRPAVYVTSAGESRSHTNRVLLEGTKYS